MRTTTTRAQTTDPSVLISAIMRRVTIFVVVLLLALIGLVVVDSNFADCAPAPNIARQHSGCDTGNQIDVRLRGRDRVRLPIDN